MFEYYAVSPSIPEGTFYISRREVTAIKKTMVGYTLSEILKARQDLPAVGYVSNYNGLRQWFIDRADINQLYICDRDGWHSLEKHGNITIKITFLSFPK